MAKFKVGKLKKVSDFLKSEIDGADGAQGLPGIQGGTGPVGPQGPIGPKGDMGDTGPQGDRGVRGHTGASGPLGIQGMQGELGPMPQHQSRGDAIRFEIDTGVWGSWINIAGGGRVIGAGAGAAGSGGSALEILDEGISLSTAVTSIDVVGAGAVATNVAGAVTLTIPGSTGFQGFGRWRYRTATGPTPAAGQLQFDNAVIDSATNLYVNVTNDGGTDMSAFLALVEIGDLIYIQVSDDSTQFVVCEVGTPALAAGVYTFPLTSVEGQGTTPTNNTEVTFVTSGGGGSPLVDHGATTGLGDDDHSQYLLLAGRAGGQTAIGGTVAGNALTLQGSSAGGDVGFVDVNSPTRFTYDTFSDATQFLMSWTANPSVTGSYIGGCLSTAVTFDVATGVFIPAIFSDTNRYNIGAAPGFSAITFINELSVVANDGNFNLPSALVINVGLTHERNTSGTSTTPGTTGLSFSPQTRATVSGAVMTKTDQTAVRCSPTWSTVGGSTVNLGTVRGLHIFNPANALFQPSAGVENVTAIIGLDMNQMSSHGGAIKAVVRSAMTALDANTSFLLNNGNAHSDHGGGHIYFDDNAGIAYGGLGKPAFDVWQTWNASGYFRTYFNTAAPSELRWSNPAADRFLFDNGGGSTTGQYNWNCAKFSIGAQTGAVGNSKGAFVAGAETVTVGGEFTQYLLTQGANDTINAALGMYAGWTINAPSPTIGTGSLTTGVALNVGGNPSTASTNRIGVRILSNPTGGSGVNAALWVTAGRSQFDGFIDINKPIALGGGANATLGAIGGTGPTAAAQAQWVQIEVNGVNHWIPAWT